ncbi:hypothetical protein [Sphingorhabdus sp. Alg239-R122]|uniref:hypothetical protein n=1 Tax=Sphingorhabdus sp. Alg239-R122 TaxID=2305989 RepID=UPI00196700A2|nr:hypothetical protein [Sphingorhabdus sp. Alg239-R122]
MMLGQIIAAGHTHENQFDASLETECAICSYAAQNDDFDVPKPISVQAIEVSHSWFPDAVSWQPVTVTFQAKARAPPYF